jgi:ubiquinone/menaquinone biosynthesis C-methylase UbiE
MWALGEKEVLISEPPENVVAEVDIEKWPGVRSGFYGREDALRIFDAYFLGNRLPRTTEQPAKILHREDKMANPENGLYDGFYKYDAVVAKSYERDRVDEVHWRLEDKFIKKYLKNKSIDRLLDLPVGTGRFIKHYNRVQCLVGIDISEDMLREARSKIDLRPPSTLTTLKKGDVANLEYPSDEFEVTIVCRLFHLLPPEVLGSAIAELCRVTKQEIVAQSYGEGDLSHGKGGGHYLRRLRVLSSSLMAQFREKLSSIESKDPKNRPWSHIQSYSHSQSAIDSMFLLGNFRIKQSVMLDSYEGSEVRMTVYEKASPA